MTVTVYGIPNCDSCRKALKWLDGKGVSYSFHDVRADGLDRTTISKWETELGEALVNRRSTTWRQLAEAERNLDDIPAQVARHPTLLKRPLLETANSVTVGFDADTWQEKLGD